MPNQTVEFYENKMKEVFPGAKLNPYLGSFSTISQQYSIPVEKLNGFIVYAISGLMHEYSYNGTGIPPKSIFRSFFSSNDNPNDQKEVARQVVLACDKAQLNTKCPIQECINDIKNLLETGLLANNLHPQDNFPKIVKAIANQTAGIKQWEFSSNAMERLNQIETANRLER